MKVLFLKILSGLSIVGIGFLGTYLVVKGIQKNPKSINKKTQNSGSNGK